MQRQDMKIILKESDNERSLSRDDLPIRIGSDLNTDIKISGSLSLGVAMIIDLIDGRYVLQKINPTLEAMINRQPLTGNHWISDGDQLEVSDKLISFNLSSELLEVKVSNLSMEDQPTQFQKRQSESIFQNKFFQRSGAVFFLVLTYFLFYLFTSKAVEIRTTPGDANISVSGGFFPHLKISGRFLLRPGEYQARYSKSGYFTDTLVIEINEESSQVFDINLKKLPGVIQFKTQPAVDYELYVNERIVNIPSYTLRPGDKIAVREKSKSLESIQNSLKLSESEYSWIKWNGERLEGEFINLPERDQIPENIKEQLIVELYSK